LFAAGAGKIGNYRDCSFNARGEGTFLAMDGANPYVGSMHEPHVEEEVRIEVIYPRHLERQILEQLFLNHPYEEVAYDIYGLENSFKEAGSGSLGTFHPGISPVDLLNMIKQKLNTGVIRHTILPPEMIRKIAVCTGSGSFLIPEALHNGADVLLTADVKYHDFLDMSGKIFLVDVGHYESEQYVKEWLHAVLIEKFPNFAVLISEKNTNPVHYFK
jgi:hypothetical protein